MILKDKKKVHDLRRRGAILFVSNFLGETKEIPDLFLTF